MHAIKSINASAAIAMAAAGALLFGLAWKALRTDRRRIGTIFGCLVLSIPGWYVASANQTVWAKELAIALDELALVQFLELAIFRGIFGTVKIPMIIRHVFLAGGFLTVLVMLAARLGANIAGIVATSTVGTAILVLGMQETLLNLLGGLVLQLERKITLGKCVELQGQSRGWVRNVSTRYTELQTPEGENILIPNNFLVKNVVKVTESLSRHSIPFHLSYDHPPVLVCDAVQATLRASISTRPGVPQPQCEVAALEPHSIQYTAIIYQTGPHQPSSSEVRKWIYYSLARAGYPLVNIPVTARRHTDFSYRAFAADDREIRMKALRGSEIFRVLDERELERLTESFVRLLYARKEVIATRRCTCWSEGASEW